jgi:hypothetical protein
MAHRQCPTCGWDLRRIHRLPEDRLLRGAEAVHRFRCTNPACKWEGTRPASRPHRRSVRGEWVAGRGRALAWLLALATAALVAVATIRWCLPE